MDSINTQTANQPTGTVNFIVLSDSSSAYSVVNVTDIGMKPLRIKSGERQTLTLPLGPHSLRVFTSRAMNDKSYIRSLYINTPNEVVNVEIRISGWTNFINISNSMENGARLVQQNVYAGNPNVQQGVYNSMPNVQQNAYVNIPNNQQTMNNTVTPQQQYGVANQLENNQPIPVVAQPTVVQPNTAQPYVSQTNYQYSQKPKMNRQEFFRSLARHKMGKEITTAGIVLYVVAGINLTLGMLAMMGSDLSIATPLNVIDGLVNLGLGLGIHLGKSRVCSIIILVYWALSILISVVTYGS